MKISCLGDSVTSGWGVRAEETWVSLLNAEGAHQFCNDGLIGDTLTGMLSRLDSQILPGKPDMVIILGGWNDLLLCKSPDTAKSALMATVHHCVRAGVIPVVAAIRSFGVEATLSGRNDILVNGAKISGNAQYYRYDRVIHHGTILFSSDLEGLSRVLNVDRSKFQGKGIASVESRVTNLSAHLPADVGLMDLRRRLREYIMEQETLEPLELTQEDREAVRLLQQRYDSWEWNYGDSPSFRRSEKRRFPNCGTVQVDYEMERGILTEIRIQGDFFGERDVAELEQQLKGCTGGRSALLRKLKDLQPEKYIYGVDAEALAQMMAPEEEA